MKLSTQLQKKKKYNKRKEDFSILHLVLSHTSPDTQKDKDELVKKYMTTYIFHMGHSKDREKDCWYLERKWENVMFNGNSRFINCIQLVPPPRKKKKL